MSPKETLEVHDVVLVDLIETAKWLMPNRPPYDGNSEYLQGHEQGVRDALQAILMLHKLDKNKPELYNALMQRREEEPQ